MFDRQHELSSDLVWLLQSQQVEDGILARMLVQEYYAQLQPFWEALLNDPQKARRATQETLTTALIKANTFHETQSVLPWLTGLAVDLYRKDPRNLEQGNKPATEKELRLGQFSPATRLAAVLHFRLNYPQEDVADFLGENLTSTVTRLEAAHKLLLSHIGNGNPSGEHQAEGDLLAQAFQRAYPKPMLSEEDLERVSQEVIAGFRRRRRELQRSAYWKEIGLISAVILLVLVWMARANLNAPEATPTPPAGRAFSGGILRRTLQPSATPSPLPTWMAPARSSSYTLVPTQWTPTPIPQDALYTVQEGDTFQEIANSLGTTVEQLRSLNRLPPEASLYPGEQLLIPGRLQLSTPVANAEISRSRPTPTPPARTLTPDEILESLNNFYFNSFWVDLNYIYRGPQGYLGEALTYRMQLWQTPSGALILTGQNPYTPDLAIKWWRWNVNKYYVASLESGSPWFKSGDFTGVISQFVEPLSFVFSLHTDYWKDQLIKTLVVGSGQVGDRPVYILKQYTLQQQLLRTLWIDKVSSLPLYIQVYDPHNPRRITTEMMVTGLEINPDIPEAFFNPQIPWMGGYAKNSRADPFSPGENLSPWEGASPTNIPRPYTPAPKNLNLATSALQFQYKDSLLSFPGVVLGDPYKVAIFAGDKYLGFANLPDPFHTLCARSADGKRMAYAPASATTLNTISGEALPGGLIYWIDLTDPEMRHTTAPNLWPFSFAFSPDGEQLAVFGKSNALGINVVDLRSDEVRHLRDVDNATSLVWKPDGTQLAFISRTVGSPNSFNLIVLDAESGKLLSRQPYPAPGNSPAQNILTSPPLDWGVPFPVGMGDLGACAAPPAGK
jgi:DNA-directed RNA polymerase specialized sigma24 family protein